jgi:hypothetical protein
MENGKDDVYDSADDTLKHQARVAEFIFIIMHQLEERALTHDNSKLLPPEKETFDRVTSLLKGLTYGSDEYKRVLRDIKPALDHHYRVNRHHPEHFSDGMSGMNLVDIVEMLCDWAAASERHSDGDLRKSIILNADRYRYEGVLGSIFENTASLLGK